MIRANLLDRAFHRPPGVVQRRDKPFSPAIRSRARTLPRPASAEVRDRELAAMARGSRATGTPGRGVRIAVDGLQA
jgi:hypothetical protein